MYVCVHVCMPWYICYTYLHFFGSRPQPPGGGDLSRRGDKYPEMCTYMYMYVCHGTFVTRIWRECLIRENMRFTREISVDVYVYDTFGYVWPLRVCALWICLQIINTHRMRVYVHIHIFIYVYVWIFITDIFGHCVCM